MASMNAGIDDFVVPDPEPVACPIFEEQRIPVTDEDFVPKGFHENSRCQETGGIKITEENKHLHKNIEFLKRRYEEGWATEDGVTYTFEMTGCVPTQDEILSLSLHQGINLRGRIVTEGGSVHDADTQNEMDNILQNQNSIVIQRLVFQYNDQYQHFLRTSHQTPPSTHEIKESDVILAKVLVDYEPHGEFGGLTDITIRRGEFVVIKEKTNVDWWTGYVEGRRDNVGLFPSQFVEVMGNIPKGEYKLKEVTTKKSQDGLTMFSMCDVKQCCLMGHLMIPMLASGAMPERDKQLGLKFIKERPMYKKKDEVNGNFDICYHCLSKTF